MKDKEIIYLRGDATDEEIENLVDKMLADDEAPEGETEKEEER